jgi:hypothetical protein
MLHSKPKARIALACLFGGKSEVMASIDQKLQRWAFKALDLGFGCFSDGDHAPFILLIDEIGKRHLIELKNVTGVADSKLVEAGREVIRGFESGRFYGLVWDGYLTTEGVRQDAVCVEAATSGGAKAFVFAQAYRQQKRSKQSSI